MTRRYPLLPPDRRREKAFVEHEPVINHPPEAGIIRSDAADCFCLEPSRFSPRPIPQQEYAPRAFVCWALS